jgi:hypothetical protein
MWVVMSLRERARLRSFLADFAELTPDFRDDPLAFDNEGLAFLAIKAPDPAEVQLQEREELARGVVKLIGDPRSFSGTDERMIVDARLIGPRSAIDVRSSHHFTAPRSQRG